LKAQLEKVIEKRQREITKILTEYGVPILERKASSTR
jgi:hypothetical protein